jgi:hypothetical protein
MLAVTGERILADGTLWSEARLRESAAGPVPVRVPELGDDRVVGLGGGWMLGIWQVPPAKLVGGFYEDESSKDPFAPFDPFDPNPGSGHSDVEMLSEMEIPRRLSKWLSGTGVDMRSHLEKAGVSLGDSGIALYDASAHWVLVCTKNANAIERLRKMFSLENCAPAALLRTEFEIERSGENGNAGRYRCFLASRSGPQAEILWKSEDEKPGSAPLFRWRVSGGQGDREDDIKLSSDIRFSPETTFGAWSEQKSFTMTAGKPETEEKAIGRNGQTFRRTIRAEFVPIRK